MNTNEENLMRVVNLNQVVYTLEHESIVLRTYYGNRVGYQLSLDDEVIFEGTVGAPMGECVDSDSSIRAIINFIIYSKFPLTDAQEEFLGTYGDELETFVYGIESGIIELGEETWR